MQNVIFPMKVINITQRANGGYSHKGHQHWDIAGSDSGIESVYAPCRVKLLAKWGNCNTLIFGSCDGYGNPAKVKTENGAERVLSFAFTHDNSISDMSIGTIYQSGERIYDEGTKGQATGNHVHVEVAEGWQYKKCRRSDGIYDLNNIVPIGDIFYQLKNWNIIKRANGYTFKQVDGRDKVTLAEAMRAFSFVAGKKKPSAEDLKVLDVNGDGKITLSDAMQLFKIVAGK